LLGRILHNCPYPAKENFAITVKSKKPYNFKRMRMCMRLKKKESIHKVDAAPTVI
jgi:hypothetical protein